MFSIAQADIVRYATKRLSRGGVMIARLSMCALRTFRIAHLLRNLRRFRFATITTSVVPLNADVFNIAATSIKDYE